MRIILPRILHNPLWNSVICFCAGTVCAAGAALVGYYALSRSRNRELTLYDDVRDLLYLKSQKNALDSSLKSLPINILDIMMAGARIFKYTNRTRIATSRTMDKLACMATSAPPEPEQSVPRRVLFKCECFQRSGSFKFRGATNAVLSLSDEQAKKGVVTHSSGNHAQALALAAKQRGIPAYIVMPRTAPAIKQRAVRGYGAEVTLCDPSNEAREQAAQEVAKRTGAFLVHPSNEPMVMAGQGTMAIELLAQAREELGSPSDGGPILDAVIVPVGGGGMLSGVAVALRTVDPRIRVIAAEPEGADDAYRSLAAGALQAHREGHPDTVADGLKTTLGSNTWPVVRDLVDRVVLVSEEQIKEAVRLVWERMKLAVEPSAGVGVAALMSEEVRGIARLRRIGVILCGGNADVGKVGAWLSEGNEAGSDGAAEEAGAAPGGAGAEET